MTWVAARLIAIGLACLTLGSVVVLWLASEVSAGMGPAEWAAIRFTLCQAGLSALVATILAVPLARALFRRRFRGRDALITLLGAPFVLPVLAAVLGLLTVFGPQGPVNSALQGLGLPPFSVFGLHGVVLAHVFLNLPLATRMILIGWQSVPPERFRLADSLGLSPSARFRHIEAAMLARVLPGAALAVFLICLTSFAVALTLGGGPRATTVELMIYQSLRYEFDLGQAARLALVQFALSGAATIAAIWLIPATLQDAGRGRRVKVAAPGGWGRVMDGLAILGASLFLVLPLLAVVLRGLPGLDGLPAGIWPAAARSLVVALASAVLTTALTLVLALALARRAVAWVEVAAMLPLASSSLVMGTALFLVTRPLSPDMLALPVTLVTNVTLTLPFALRLVLPHARRLEADYGRLAASLGMAGAARLRLLALPRLGRPLAFAAGLSAALSMGDLGVIALFSGEGSQTLPLLIARLTGAYRIEAAASASLVLVILSLALFWAIDRLGARDVDA
jgi:thiamine transport system permease protein